MEKIQSNLEKGIPARNLALTEQEAHLAEHLFLLSFKPVLYAANIAEDDMLTDPKQIPMVKQVLEYAEKEQSEVLVISAQVEEEIAQLDPEERNAFLKELGLPESGLDRLIKRSYHLLGLISFFNRRPKGSGWTMSSGAPGQHRRQEKFIQFRRALSVPKWCI